DEFSWSSVASSAIGGAATAGAGSLIGGSLGGQEALQNTVARATLGNLMSQGVSVVSGLQKKFSWTSMASSAVGAAAGFGAQRGLLSQKVSFGSDLGNQLGYGMSASLANGGFQSLVFHEKPNWSSIAI